MAHGRSEQVAQQIEKVAENKEGSVGQCTESKVVEQAGEVDQRGSLGGTGLKLWHAHQKQRITLP